MKKIAIFSPTIDVRNGYGNITYEYCFNLSKKGIDYVLFLPRNKEHREFFNKTKLNCEVRYVLPKYIFLFKLHNFWRYLRPIKVKDCDVVHSLFAFPYCVLALFSAKVYKKKFMMGAQGTYGVLPLTYKLEGWLLKQCYRLAKVVIVPSVYTRDKILELSQGKYDIKIIHNGVNLERFDKHLELDDLKKQYLNKKILLTVGGLKDRKGQDLVIRALKDVKKVFPDAIYLLVGDGWRKADWIELSKEMGVEDSVLFLGNKSGDELVKYFKLCDVYVHTPKVVDLNFEGFGIVYLEASACQKPIVATDAGGIRDAVLDGKTGIVVADGDIVGIAQSIIKILKDNELATDLSLAGYDYAKEHTWSKITDKYINEYNLI